MKKLKHTNQLGEGNLFECIRATLKLAEILAIASLAGWASVGYSQLAASTFEAGSDGWSVVDRVINGLAITNIRAAVWTNTGGNAGVYIYAMDANGDFYLRAPAKFLGDKSAAYGYSLQFDLMDVFVGSHFTER